MLNIKELCRNCERSKVAVRRPLRRTYFFIPQKYTVFLRGPRVARTEVALIARTRGFLDYARNDTIILSFRAERSAVEESPGFIVKTQDNASDNIKLSRRS